MLTKEGLITMERAMHDGTRIKAHAGRDTFRKEGTIRELILPDAKPRSRPWKKPPKKKRLPG